MRNILTFHTSELRGVCDHETLHRSIADGDSGLYLVSMRGVYFSASVDHVTGAGHDHEVVAYARECDPRVLGEDQCSNVKARTFGDTDGIEFVPINTVIGWLSSDPGAGIVGVDFSDDHFVLVNFRVPRLTNKRLLPKRLRGNSIA